LRCGAEIRVTATALQIIYKIPHFGILIEINGCYLSS